MNVFIIAPSVKKFQEVSDILFAAGGYETAGIPNGVRETRPDKLSSEQLTELADEVKAACGEADVVVLSTDRQMWPSNSFFAGYALARRTPVVVVGPFDEVGLYASRIIVSDLTALSGVLKKIDKAKKDAAEVYANVMMGKYKAFDAAVRRAPTFNPERENDSVPALPNASDSQGQPDGGPVGSDGGGSDVSDGSHI